MLPNSEKNLTKDCKLYIQKDNFGLVIRVRVESELGTKLCTHQDMIANWVFSLNLPNPNGRYCEHISYIIVLSIYFILLNLITFLLFRQYLVMALIVYCYVFIMLELKPLLF